MQTKLSKEQYEKIHRDMWNYIARGLTTRKLTILGEFDAARAKFEFLQTAYPHVHLNFLYSCAACEYACEQEMDHFSCGSDRFSMCNYCLFEWPSKCSYKMCVHNNYHGDFNGLFARFYSELDLTKQVELAKEIANLKVRDTSL